jgi:N-acetylmuramoyl-L-alanine amidase
MPELTPTPRPKVRRTEVWDPEGDTPRVLEHGGRDSRRTDLSRKTINRMAIGGFLLATLVIVWAILASNTITPQGIVIHHSSLLPTVIPLGPHASGRAPADPDAWDEFHRIRGFSVFYWGHFYHLGYHYMILPDGTVKSGRPEHCVGAHAKGFNTYLGIVLIGDFSSKSNPNGAKALARPTAEQMRALISLSQRLRDRYSIPMSRIVRHHDIARTQCPGDRFPYDEFLKQIQ